MSALKFVEWLFPYPFVRILGMMKNGQDYDVLFVIIYQIVNAIWKLF